MKTTCGVIGILIIVAITILVTAEDSFDNPPGVVVLLVRGPNGKRLAEQAVTVTAWEQFGRNYGHGSKGPTWTLETDKDGRVRFPWPAGVRQFRVTAPGVGYGGSGRIRVRPGQTIEADLPPLAPLATITGQVDRKTSPDCQEITCEARDFPRDHKYSATVNINGSFRFDDLPEGAYWLRSAQTKSVRVVLQPGQQQHVELQPRGEPVSRPTSTGTITLPHAGQVSELTGRVTDETGRPVGGATVFVSYKYYGAIRVHEQALVTVTDEDGHYRITGFHRGKPVSTAVIVQKEGFAPGCAVAVNEAAMRRWMARLSVAEDLAADPATESLQADVVIAAKGGGLDVTVDREGQPFPEAMVLLQSEDWGSFFSPRWALGRGDDEVGMQWRRIIHPSSITDAEGVARFKHLPPGAYTVYAYGGAKREQMEPSPFLNQPWSTDPFARQIGVPVVVGRTGRLRLSLHSRSARKRPTARVLGPDGRTVPEEMVYVGTKAAGTERNRWRRWGAGYYPSLRHSNRGTGLLRLVTTYPSARQLGRETDTALSYASQKVFAISALLPPDPVWDCHAVGRDGATVIVKLVDAAGKSARGSVTTRGLAGSTGPHTNRVRFTDLKPGQYRFFGHLANAKPLPILRPGVTDEELTGVELVAPEDVDVAADEEVTVTLRAQPAGYVRGRLLTADGKNAFGRYRVGGSSSRAVVYDDEQGEFVCGPIPAGETKLWVHGPGSGRRYQRVAPDDETIIVPPGGVLHHHIHLLPEDEQRPVLRWRALAGRVLRPDGQTPAYGARVLVFEPDTAWPVGKGWSAPTGAFRIHGGGGPVPNPDDPPGSPTTRVAVAWLPGECGPTVVPLADDTASVDIVLPSPVALSGRVTVGGERPENLPVFFGVLARHEGRGKLDEVFSVFAEANHDGTFTLHGLARGTYMVQATMDYVWLSDSVRVTVGEGAPKPIHLDIPAPGGHAVVQLLDGNGRVLADRRIIVDVPVGPLTDLLRPASLLTDGAGEVLLAGLPAGPNRITLANEEAPLEVTVPPASVETQATRQVITLERNASTERQ